MPGSVSWLPRLLLLAVPLMAGCTTKAPAKGTSAPGASMLRYALTVEPTTLDPARVSDLVTAELLMHCFEGLVRINEKNEVEPVLAEKWDLSPDGKTYTFHLRRGVKFHNGRGVTADDVRYSWERALAPNTHSPVASNYLAGVVGVAEMATGKRKELTGVTVVDTHTLRVTIDQPRAYFLGMLTYPSNFVVCREAVEKAKEEETAETALGTGPYRLTEYRRGYQVTLTANPDYWGGKPKIARIEAPILLAPETTYANFETKNLDLYPLNIPLSHYAADKQTGKFTAEYKLLPGAQVDYLVMHPRLLPAFAKQEVRTAFAMAIDREEIRRIAYQSTAQIAHGIVPPSLPGSGTPPPPIPYDPAAARKLLAQAGYPEGKGFPELTLVVPQQPPQWLSACEMIQANLRDNLGIKVTLQEREWAQFLKDTTSESVPFYITGWIADYPDPQDFLSTLLASASSLNRYGYHNARFDRLCAEADADKDPNRRSQLYGQANRILMEEVGVLPLVYPSRIILIQPNIQGWKANLCNILPLSSATKR
jgi:oligopeptide transport system substrate-binding protein